MSVYGVCMCRDEMDVLPWTLPRMQSQLDGIVIADNLSKDGTREWLEEYAADNDVVVVHDDELGYMQSQKMTRLGHLAADLGADWIVPFDADEVWWCAEGPLRRYVETSGEVSLAARLQNHIATGVDAETPDPVKRMTWRLKEIGALPKVAFRVLPGFVIAQGNHDVYFPRRIEAVGSKLWVSHFPYRSAEQMVRKAMNGAEAYRATDLPYTTGAHWRDYGALVESQGADALSEVFYTWFWSADPEGDPALVYDPCPVPMTEVADGR